MKIVGHAATAHNTVAEHMSATLRERGGGGGGGLRLGGSIAEGEEQEDAEEEGQEEGDQIAEVVGAGLNITGYSGFRRKSFIRQELLVAIYSLLLIYKILKIYYIIIMDFSGYYNNYSFSGFAITCSI